MSNITPDSDPGLTSEPEAELPELPVPEILGDLALGSTVTPPASKPKWDFEAVTFESFLHAIGW